MGRLDGKVALITGAGRGQGAEAARRFVAEGARVMLADVLVDEPTAVADELGDAAGAVHLDVTSEAMWSDAIDATLAAFDGLDVLVNNAGITDLAPIAKTPPERFRRVIDVNLMGTYMGIRAAIGPMVAGGGGSIVNTSSVQGMIGAGGISGYVASKFAIRGLTKTAALELGPAGIRVNSIHPGPIDTPMTQPEAWGGFDMRPTLARTTALGRMGTVDDVASLLVFLASDESGYCTGAEFVIDGGMLAGPQYDFPDMTGPS